MVKGKTLIIFFIMAALLFLIPACGGGSSSSYSTDISDDTTTTDSTTTDSSDSTSEDEVTRPDGWTEETHGKNAEPNYDVVFNDSEVGRIDLTISSSDWESMMNDDNIVSVYGEFGSQSGTGTTVDPNAVTVDPNTGGGMPPIGGGGGGVIDQAIENPIWVPCTFKFNGITWNYTGVRFKGNSSLRDAWQSGTYKIPFRFNFDKFEDTYPEIDNQRFYGFKKLTLSSNYKDDSLIREKVTADIFRALGVPAPRTAFYRLFIDCGDGEGSKYFGLYTMVEVPADPMLDSQFGNSDGNLYKPDGTTASFGAGELSEVDFDKENNEDEADFSDVNALYTAINAASTDSASWESNLEAVFNVDGFLNWLAVNTVIQNWDTYGTMTHNYYLYNDNGLLSWIPWDNNESLKDSDLSVMAPLSLALDESSLSSWPLIRNIMDDSNYQAVYKNYVAKTVADYFNPSNMDAIYETAHNLIYNYVVGDDGEQPGYTLLSNDDAFINSLDYLETHVENRQNAVSDYLE